MIKFLEGKSLEERQRRYYNGYTCPYCDELTDYVDSAIVYQESHGMIHYCKPCEAWVGCHSGSDQSYGFVAKKHLRFLRHETHKFFDPLWQSKVSKGLLKKNAAQVAARRWVATFMEIDITEAHIGMMDTEQCNKLIAECKKYHLTPEQVADKQQAAKERINIVKGICDFWDIELKEFYLNGSNRMEMRHSNSEKILLYDPKQNTGGWLAAKMKWQPVEQLFTFIDKSFKLNKDEV